MVKLLHQVKEPCQGQLSMRLRSNILVYKNATSRGEKVSKGPTSISTNHLLVYIQDEPVIRKQHYRLLLVLSLPLYPYCL